MFRSLDKTGNTNGVRPPENTPDMNTDAQPDGAKSTPGPFEASQKTAPVRCAQKNDLDDQKYFIVEDNDDDAGGSDILDAITSACEVVKSLVAFLDSKDASG